MDDGKFTSELRFGDNVPVTEDEKKLLEKMSKTSIDKVKSKISNLKESLH